VESPKTAKAALEAIEAQRVAADDIRQVVIAGRLEETGIKVLNLIPKLTVSGRVLVQTVTLGKTGTIAELREQQLNSLLDTAEVAWKNTDVLIQQGLQGRLGVCAVAQIRIASDLVESTAALDDFLAAIRSALSSL
jgi:hypothetical protein